MQSTGNHTCYVQNTIGKVKEEKKKSKSNNKKMKEIMKNDKEWVQCVNYSWHSKTVRVIQFEKLFFFFLLSRYQVILFHCLSGSKITIAKWIQLINRSKSILCSFEERFLYQKKSSFFAVVRWWHLIILNCFRNWISNLN